MGKINDPSFLEIFIDIIFPLAVNINICWTYCSVLALNETCRNMSYTLHEASLGAVVVSLHLSMNQFSASLEPRKTSYRQERMSLRTQVTFKIQSSWVNIMCFRDTSAKPFFHLHSTEWMGKFLCSWKKTHLIQLTGAQRENIFLKNLYRNVNLLWESVVTYLQYVYVLITCYLWFVTSNWWSSGCIYLSLRTDLWELNVNDNFTNFNFYSRDRERRSRFCH